MKVITDYINQINSSLKTGDATESSHRPALKTLLESSFGGLAALNEPKRQELGAPDFIIMRNGIPIGYIETKDINVSLDAVEETEQLQRYLDGLDNLILTNYLEFRWYVRGKLRLDVKLGTLSFNNTIRRISNQDQNLKELLQNFVNQDVKIIKSSEELAMRMATLSKMSYRVIYKTLQFDKDQTSDLYRQFKAIEETLIHGITIEEFSDMLAQTISYGLFTARINQSDAKSFNRMTAAYIIPKTNPFLRDLFSQVVGPSINPNLIWIVEDLIKLLKYTDIELLINSIDTKEGKKDPMLHFYETFIVYYKPEERILRGVYYTPDSVVEYIIKCVDYLLEKKFDTKEGLADTSKTRVRFTGKDKQEFIHKVQILDPAVGTGTFLSSLIDYIFNKSFQNNKGMWSDYVKSQLLPRLSGFELLMAPYTIAHMKLGLKLMKTGYLIDSEQRLRIYLNNSLEKPDEETGFPLFSSSNSITGEAEEANSLKKDYPVMVIMGNPPYNSRSANNIDWLSNLMRGFDEVHNADTENYFSINGKSLGETNTKWLNDDYVKFIRFSQWRIEQTGYGILAFITPHGYLDNPTFRGMRKSLMNTFEDIYILDLHGNANKQEGKKTDDQNVFDIKQGTAIGIFVKSKKNRRTTRVFHSELWGDRESKYRWLNENKFDTTNWEEISPKEPLYLFVPQDDTYQKEYEKGWLLVHAMPSNSTGIVTARDHLTIHKDKNELIDVIKDLSNLDTEEDRMKYNLGRDVRDWKVKFAQKDLIDSGLDEDNIERIYYRPFDYRYTYYTGETNGFLCRPRKKIMNHFIDKDNIAIVTSRMTKGENFQHLAVTNSISDAAALSGKSSNNAYSFPLYIYKGNEKVVNFSEEFIKDVEEKTKLSFSGNTSKENFNEIDLFNYIVAILSSPTYRERYREYLKRDYPKIPITSNANLFKELSNIGRKIVDIHLFNLNPNLTVNYPVEGNNLINKLSYDESECKVWINGTQYFSNIGTEVWNYEIGGYQVLKKWLNSRKSEILDYENLLHFQEMVEYIKLLIKTQDEVDRLILSNNGFPLE